MARWSELSQDYRRVTKSVPCPVCSKPDWCLVHRDGTNVICKRVESDRPRGDSGYLHYLSEPIPSLRGAKKIVHKDHAPSGQWEELLQQGKDNTSYADIEGLAQELGVTPDAVIDSEVVKIPYTTKKDREIEVWAYTMRDDRMRATGMRLEYHGHKFSYEGSRNGHFLGVTKRNGPLLIVEGNRDAVAARSLGFEAIGRPNCNSRVRQLHSLVIRFYSDRQVVFIPDNDTPDARGVCAGLDGALKAARVIAPQVSSTKLVMPPEDCNDLREGVDKGLTRECLLNMIYNTDEFDDALVLPERLDLGLHDARCSDCAYYVGGVCHHEVAYKPAISDKELFKCRYFERR